MLDSAELAHQWDLAVRLLLAASLGAFIGLEREVHSHAAGMRTHLLVSLGAAMFTVVSIYGFVDTVGSAGTAPVDPSRVAAQIVTGIGFIGAGAIMKYGPSIRGLTTAGSLWATAAIGMAAGAGQVGIAVSGGAIVLFSLWPLHWILSQFQVKTDETIRIRLGLQGLDPLWLVTQEFTRLHVEITDVKSERTAKDRYVVELDVKPKNGTAIDGLLRHITAIPDVELLEAAS
jgi:putative Mg2+ transporter-C (MgtC) family protein